MKINGSGALKHCEKIATRPITAVKCVTYDDDDDGGTNYKRRKWFLVLCIRNSMQWIVSGFHYPAHQNSVPFNNSPHRYFLTKFTAIANQINLKIVDECTINIDKIERIGYGCSCGYTEYKSM